MKRSKYINFDIYCSLKFVSKESDSRNTVDNTGQVIHAFLIGTTNGEILTSQVKQEHVDFDDIIQFSFYESYRNLTLKTLMGN